MPRPIITLTTDFGTGSPYVAQMKAVVLGIAPEAELIDVTHGIAPQQIVEGAVILSDVCRHFPAGTIHVAVIDPGVGTRRLVLAAEIDQQVLIAPDNGLLTVWAGRSPPSRIVQLNRSEYWQPRVSNTFHGRDVMAAVAAHLARGVPITEVGDPLEQFVILPDIEPVHEQDGIHGRCLWVDAFGNLISNIERSMLPDDLQSIRVFVDQRQVPLVLTYGAATPGSLVALFGSSDRLEIAQVQGSAASALGHGRECKILVDCPTSRSPASGRANEAARGSSQQLDRYDRP